MPKVLNRRVVRKWSAGVSLLLLLGLLYVLLNPGVRYTYFPESLWPAKRPFVWRYENVKYPDTRPAQMGDGGPARDMRFQDPAGLAEDSEGNVYVSDRGHYVWKIDSQGRASVLVGTGRQGGSPVDIDARKSDLGIPEGLSVDDLGRVYLADSRNNLILARDPDGRLSRVAGTGARGYGGDNGPAVDATLNRPFEVRLDSRGNIYIVDYGNNRIRKITADGIIRTVAGSGEIGRQGDGGPATDADLGRPFGIFIDSRDRLLIADTDNHLIRRIDEAGVIDTIAGTGQAGYTGDGGPATDAPFNAPQALFVDTSGRIYVNDEHNHALRIIDHDGTISSLMGDGSPGYEGDGGPSQQAKLNDPESVLVRSDGSVLISDSGNHLIRAIDVDGTVSVFAGRFY